MYDAVVVEDEERILNNICNRIEKLSARFRVAARFDDPLRALEWLRSHPADVLLTDIRMPGMDGLSLLEELKSSRPAYCAIISSYQDFSYAQKAIRLNVCEYLLKPFLDEELNALLTRLADQLDSEMTDRLADELNGFLRGGPLGEYLERRCAAIGAGGRGSYSLAALSLPHEALFQGEGLNAVEPSCTGSELLLPLPEEDRVICFCAVQGGDQPARLLAREWAGRGGTGVYTPCVSSLGELPAFYLRLGSGFSAASYPERGNYVELGQTTMEVRDLSLLEEEYTRLEMVCRNGMRDAVSERLQVVAQRFKELSLSRQELEQQVCALMLRLSISLGLPFPDLRRFSATLHNTLSGCTTYREVTDAVAEDLRALTVTDEGEGKQGLARSIRQYLDQNADGVVSLSDLEEHFGFSQTYLLRVFRDALGTSPIEYLITKKMERAKELLGLFPEKTVREIGEALSYSNQYYFSRVFKREVGVSPAEYRRSH